MLKKGRKGKIFENLGKNFQNLKIIALKKCWNRPWSINFNLMVTILLHCAYHQICYMKYKLC